MRTEQEKKAQLIKLVMDAVPGVTAKQVISLLAEYGRNKLQGKVKTGQDRLISDCIKAFMKEEKTHADNIKIGQAIAQHDGFLKEAMHQFTLIKEVVETKHEEWEWNTRQELPAQIGELMLSLYYYIKNKDTRLQAWRETVFVTEWAEIESELISHIFTSLHTLVGEIYGLGTVTATRRTSDGAKEKILVTDMTTDFQREIFWLLYNKVQYRLRKYLQVNYISINSEISLDNQIQSRQDDGKGEEEGIKLEDIQARQDIEDIALYVSLEGTLSRGQYDYLMGRLNGTTPAMGRQNIRIREKLIRNGIILENQLNKVRFIAKQG